MTHGHPHEEAEHAEHHAHNPFDRRVAMSMVVVAAVLAAVKVLAHREHNATLAYQIKSGKSATEAASIWNRYQSKRQRMSLVEQEAAMLQFMLPPGKPREAPSKAALPKKAKTQAFIAEELNAEKVKEPEAKAKKIVADGEKAYNDLRAQGHPDGRAERIAGLGMTAARYKLENAKIQEKARSLDEKASKYSDASAVAHAKADYLDIAELLVELGIVVCSVSILTKQKQIWYGGLAVAAVGTVIAALAYLPARQTEGTRDAAQVASSPVRRG